MTDEQAELMESFSRSLGIVFSRDVPVQAPIQAPVQAQGGLGELSDADDLLLILTGENFSNFWQQRSLSIEHSRRKLEDISGWVDSNFPDLTVNTPFVQNIPLGVLLLITNGVAKFAAPRRH
jgi:hypothetical protein